MHRATSPNHYANKAFAPGSPIRSSQNLQSPSNYIAMGPGPQYVMQDINTYGSVVFPPNSHPMIQQYRSNSMRMPYSMSSSRLMGASQASGQVEEDEARPSDLSATPKTGLRSSTVKNGGLISTQNVIQVENKVDELIAHNERLSKIVEQQRGEIKEYKELELKVKMLLDEIQRVNSMLLASEKENQILRENIHELEKLKVVEGELSNSSEENDKLKRVVGELNQQLEYWKGRYREMQESEIERVKYLGLLENAEKDIQNLVSQNERINQNLIERSREIETWKSRFMELETDYNEKDFKIAQLIEEHEKMEEFIQRQSLNEERNRDEIEKREESVRKAIIQEYEEKLKVIIEENEKLGDLLNERLKELEDSRDMQERLIVLSNEVEKLNDLIKNQEGFIQDLQNESHQKLAVSQENKTLELRVNELSQKLVILIEENERLTDIVEFKADEKQEVLHVKQQSDVLLSQNNNLMAVIKDQSDKIESLRGKLADNERAYIEDLNKRNNEKNQLILLNEELNMKLNQVLEENQKVNGMVKSLFEEKDGYVQRVRELENAKKKLEKDTKKFRLQLSSRVDVSQMLMNIINYQKISSEEIRFAEKDLKSSKGESRNTPGRQMVSGDEASSDKKGGSEPRAKAQEGVSEDELAVLESESASNQERISRLEKIIVETSVRREELLMNMQYVNQVRENYEARIRGLMEDNRELSKNLEQANQDFIDLRDQRNNEIEHLDQKITALLEVNEQLQNQNEQYMKELSEKAELLDKLSDDYNELHGNFMKAQSELAQAVRENETLAKFRDVEMKEVEIRISTERRNWERDQANLIERLGCLEREALHYRSDNESLCAQAIELNKDIERTRQELKQRNQEVNKKNFDLDNYKQMALEFEEFKQIHENELNGLNTQVSQYKAIIENNKIELARLYDLLKARKQGSDDFMGRFDELKQENENLLNLNNSLESHLADTREKLTLIDKEVARLERERNDLKLQLQRREEDNVNLRRDLEEKIEIMSKSRKEWEEAANSVMKSAILNQK